MFLLKDLRLNHFVSIYYGLSLSLVNVIIMLLDTLTAFIVQSELNRVIDSSNKMLLEYISTLCDDVVIFIVSSDIGYYSECLGFNTIRSDAIIVDLILFEDILGFFLCPFRDI